MPISCSRPARNVRRLPDGGGRRLALLAVWLLGSLLAFAPARAVAADPINVATSTATPNFPAGINFQLHASSSSAIEHVELLYSLAASATEQLINPSFTPGRSITATAKAPLGTDYVPAGIDITYHWRIEDASGATFETKPQTVLWEDARFSWTLVSGPYVTIYSYKASPDFQKYMLDLAEKYIASEMKLYGMTAIMPIKVWIYDSKTDFSGTLAPNSQEWAAGSALPAFQLIQEIISGGDQSEANRLIPHELSHQILHQATENPFGILPLWLDEGLAVNNENADHSRYDDMVATANQSKSLVSIQALISEFPIDPNQASLAYAESYSIVKFMRKTYGDAKLLDLIHAFKAEMTIDGALKTAYGFDQNGLEKAWLATISESSRSTTVAAGHIGIAIGNLLSGGTLILLAAVAIAGVHRLRASRRRPDSTLLHESAGPATGQW